MMTKEESKLHRKNPRRFWNRNERPVLHFCLMFCGILLLFSGLLRTEFFQTHLITPHLHQIANLCGMLISKIGTSCEISGTTILSEKFSITIVQGCDSLYPTILLWAALLAHPVSWKSKMFGIIAGAVILFIMNIIRVISMFYLGRSFPSLFGPVHLYAWQALFILLTLAIWLLWAVKVSHERNPAGS